MSEFSYFVIIVVEHDEAKKTYNLSLWWVRKFNNMMLPQVSLYTTDGQSKISFYPFGGVTEELKTFIHDMSQATLKVV